MFGKNSDYSCQVSGSGFPENRYEALEESRKLLGLNESDFHSMLMVLSRTDYGTLDFSLGQVSISLRRNFGEEVSLGVSLGQRSMEKSAEYTFQLCELGLSKKQTKLGDFEEE